MSSNQTDTSTLIGIGVLGQSLQITSAQSAVDEARQGILKSSKYGMFIENMSAVEPYLTLARIWQCHHLGLKDKEYLQSISNSRFWKSGLQMLAAPSFFDRHPATVKSEISEVLAEGIPRPMQRGSSGKELLIKHWIIESGRCALLRHKNLDTAKLMLRPAFEAIVDTFIQSSQDIDELWRFVVGQVAMMQPASLRQHGYTIEDVLNPARNFSERLYSKLPVLANTCADIKNAYYSGAEYAEIITKIIVESGLEYSPEQIVTHVKSQSILKELIIKLGNPDIYEHVFENRIRLSVSDVSEILNSAKTCCTNEIIRLGGLYKLHSLILRRPEKMLNSKLIADDRINRDDAIEFLKDKDLLASVAACSILNIDLRELNRLDVEIPTRLKKHLMSDGLSL